MMELSGIPLPERMRPETLDDFVGQEHLLKQGKLLRKLYDARRLVSCVLWGPPGTGKTTLAKIYAKHAEAHFVELSAVASGAKELREVFQTAAEEKRLYGMATVLFVDEIHRYTKAQQDLLLPAVERGVIYLVGSTTENPRISLTRALLSRLQVWELYRLTENDVEQALIRALHDVDLGLGKWQVQFEEDAWSMLVKGSGGDLRKAMNAMEWAIVHAAEDSSAIVTVSASHVEEALEGALGQFDESIYYDQLSAFCKSLRGSDSDAALYWFMRMVQEGVDPRIPVRRLMVHASEDVGLASPQALVQAVSAMQVLESVGLPEARIPIAQAIIFVCESPKSNSVVQALGRVEEAIRRFPHAAVPSHLDDRHFYKDEHENVNYLYPHDFPGHFVEQRYLPYELGDLVIYEPTEQGAEARIHPKRPGRHMNFNK